MSEMGSAAGVCAHDRRPKEGHCRKICAWALVSLKRVRPKGCRTAAGSAADRDYKMAGRERRTRVNLVQPGGWPVGQSLSRVEHDTGR